MRRIDAACYASRDAGLLILRLGIGGLMLGFHGWGKISGGPAQWEQIGGTMAGLGLGFLPALWGFMAAFAEFFCSLLLALGLFFRPAAALLAATMLVAVTAHLRIPAGEPGSGWGGASHALELLGVYVGLFLTGPGKYAIGLLGRKDAGTTTTT
jgi:putative oxidoreductase